MIELGWLSYADSTTKQNDQCDICHLDFEQQSGRAQLHVSTSLGIPHYLNLCPRHASSIDATEVGMKPMKTPVDDCEHKTAQKLESGEWLCEWGCDQLIDIGD